jgi:hypothetical protein
MAEVSQLKQRVSECEGEVRTMHRKLDAVGGLARLMAENALAKRRSYLPALEIVERSFFTQYERFDAAALLIQRNWRHSKNPALEKRIVRSKPVFPLAELVTLSALDAVAGRVEPLTYRRIVRLLSSYNAEMRQLIAVPIDVMRNYVVRTHEFSLGICNTVLCKGKRFAWTQTETSRAEVAVQTEVLTRGRSPRR